MLLQDKHFHNRFRNTLHAFTELKHYGFREYYRGLTPILIRNGLSNALFFTLREEISHRLPKADHWTKKFVYDFCSGAMVENSTFPCPLVESKGAQYVTCGSVIKLQNLAYKVRLHSHDVKYGSGSGQQSVTGTDVKEDVNSHWAVLGPLNLTCKRGDPVECGATIRLQHLSTRKFLHSHHFSSPLSGNQEVSAFGENGVGDSGDHWKVICDGDFWDRDDSVTLRHVDTQAYLASSGHSYGRPINGQMEIVGLSRQDQTTKWQTAEGLYIHPSSFNPKQNTHHSRTLHNEL
nr:EOG090X0E0P [Cyclestheria hislopi]